MFHSGYSAHQFEVDSTVRQRAIIPLYSPKSEVILVSPLEDQAANVFYISFVITPGFGLDRAPVDQRAIICGHRSVRGQKSHGLGVCRIPGVST